MLGIVETIFKKLAVFDICRLGMILGKIRFAALLAAGLFIWASVSAQEIGTTLVSDLRVRSGPGKDYRIVTLLPKGAGVTVVGRQKDWLKIVHNGIEGFIFHRDAFIEIAKIENSDSDQKAGQLKESTPDAEIIKEKLRKAKAKLATISSKEKEVLEAFNAADEALNGARRHVRAAKAELADVREKINAVQKRSSELEKEILVEEQYVAKRLTALYKLNWGGKIQLLATADSFFDFVRRKGALEKILAQDEALLEVLNRKKSELDVLLTRLNTSRAEKHALELTLKKRVAKLSEQQSRRKSVLQTIRGKKSLELAALKALRKSARELDATIAGIEPLKPGVVVSNASNRQDKPFKAYKGLLRWPVKGKIISFFGPYRDKKFAITNFQSGINIRAERGEPIRSVSDGHVIFSNWFKGFGNMMIIDHGDHYYTVYAHLEEVFKVKGDRVDKGEVIATVGDSGSMKGPALHFEVRHHGKPIDPLKWIQKG
ncbi:MAG: peptidoglycan DD-metalloendopeptidase family protein [Desulfobacteraceae bacterium]